MKVKGSTGERKPFEQPQPDNYPAVCTKIIDLGTQPEEYQGEQKLVHKVVLFWELSEKMSDGRPFQVNRRYTASIGDKSRLGKDLTAWRGKPFTPEEIAGFELKNVLGAPALINIIPNNKGDKTIVGSVSKLPKGMAAPQPEGDLVSFDLDNFDQSTFDGLTDYWKDLIRTSPEYQALKDRNQPPVQPRADLDADEIPF